LADSLGASSRAKVVLQLQHVSKLRRLGTIQQLVRVAKKHFTRDVSSKDLLLYGPARSVGKSRIPVFQHALVDEANHGANCHVCCIVAQIEADSAGQRAGCEPMV
jgi:hypothetical protein